MYSLSERSKRWNTLGSLAVYLYEFFNFWFLKKTSISSVRPVRHQLGKLGALIAINLPLHVTSFPLQFLSEVHILVSLPCNSKPSSHLNRSKLWKVVVLPIYDPFFGRSGKPQSTTIRRKQTKKWNKGKILL